MLRVGVGEGMEGGRGREGRTASGHDTKGGERGWALLLSLFPPSRTGNPNHPRPSHALLSPSSRRFHRSRSRSPPPTHPRRPSIRNDY